MAKTRGPFDVPLTDEQKTTIGMWLSFEVDNALAARSTQESEVDYWHALYEQARTRTSNLPWPDAADLTSYIPCEQVDSIHARMMKTVWVEPLCTVSGYGPAADRAPFVEEFHQWKVEEEDLQSVLDKAFLTGLIEPRCIVEVSESSERRAARKTINAKMVIDPISGGVVYDASGDPQLEQNDRGEFVEATDGQPAAQTVIDAHSVIRTGPAYRVLPYRDSLILPGHARDDDDVWGYAKRISKRKPDLVAQSKGPNAIYDPDAVARLTDTGDTEGSPSLDRANQSIAPQHGETAEKELWEVLWLVDLNDFLDRHNQTPIRNAKFTGARWYLVTLHTRTHSLLRFNIDDFEQSRYVPMILFPRTDRATEGFSFVGHKLITVAEEHTAYRNMAADCTAKAVSSPIMRLTGALWDPDEQPLGPKSVIDVRDPREIQALELPDVPQSVFIQQDRTERAGQRLGGINDIASGQSVQKGSPTLGEIQMATEQSFVRMDLIVRRAQKFVEKLMQVRHAIWKRVLAEQPDGVDAPDTVMVGLEGRGVPIDRYLPQGKITAALLDGPFRFKPYGSVETSDLNRMRNDWVGMMQALPMMIQTFPMLAPMFQNPAAARAMARQFFRVFRVSNPQAFLGSPSQDLLGQGGGVMPGQQMPMQGGQDPMAALLVGGMPPMGGGAAPGQSVTPPMPMPSPLGPMPPMPQGGM